MMAKDYFKKNESVYECKSTYLTYKIREGDFNLFCLSYSPVLQDFKKHFGISYDKPIKFKSKKELLLAVNNFTNIYDHNVDFKHHFTSYNTKDYLIARYTVYDKKKKWAVFCKKDIPYTTNDFGSVSLTDKGMEILGINNRFYLNRIISATRQEGINELETAIKKLNDYKLKE